MRGSFLIGSLVCFILGLVFTLTIIGFFLGIPLIILSVILLIIGLIARKKPERKHHKKNNS